MTEEDNQDGHRGVQQEVELKGAPEDAQFKDQQTAAVIAASGFIVFSAIYWFLQIQSVRELLELAYG